MNTIRHRLAMAAALVLALLTLFLLWPTDAAPPKSGAADRAAPQAASVVTADLGASNAAAASTPTQREALAAPTAGGRGDLVVRLLYGDDRSPAAGVMVTAFRKNEIPRLVSAPSVDSQRRRTDAEGIVRFPSLRAGRTGLIADRGHWLETSYVVAGKQTEVEFVMPVGVTITGLVVSSLGVPVAGAEVELESSVVATTDLTGGFRVRGATPHYSIGARAEGHGASKAQQLLAREGRAEVRLELGPAGGIVEGVAVDPDGRPIAEARVTIGSYEGSAGLLGDDPPRPARVRTDAEGRFRVIGIHPGEHPVEARARGMVPWSGKCQVAANASVSLTIPLARGNTLRGTLRDADGRPFGDVLVGAVQGDLDWDEVVHPDGTFEFAGLPDGAIDVKVDAEGKGDARARVMMVPGGAVTTCDLTLECGFVAKGKVRDAAGQGVPRVNVRWTRPAPNRQGYTFTDEHGAFAIANAPEGKLSIRIDGEAIVDAQFEVDPRAGELDLRAERRAQKTVYIAGLVLDPDGRPAAARVWASGGGSNRIVEQTTDASGYFEIGPVAPGQWHVDVDSKTFPRVSFENRTLEPNARWDLGTVRLAQGGDLRIEVVDGSVDGVWCSIQDSGQRRFRGPDLHSGNLQSEPLPVGSYRLFVGGKARAAQSFPFEIRAGERTTVAVRVIAGVRQQFDITLPEQLEPADGSLRILRGGDVVAHTWADLAEGRPCYAEECFEPGDYTVVARFGELEGSATFRVGEREGEPVRITIPQPR
ncbi:MAG: carboxypeptidase-like regulatory domain-containing protein [Planctomycetes bacterium]|nr:carboxypeptidase-like regulatory domain-containing protein [Planctomycetota bacterium]